MPIDKPPLSRDHLRAIDGEGLGTTRGREVAHPHMAYGDAIVFRFPTVSVFTQRQSPTLMIYLLQWMPGRV